MITLDIDMDEGRQFYVGTINVLGLDEPARQELVKGLPTTTGQVYTGEQWQLFLRKYSSMLPQCGCQRALGVDEHAGIVSVTLDFRPCSTD